MLERISPRPSSSRLTTAAAVSSQVVSMPRTSIHISDLILRSGPSDRVSKDGQTLVASPFETPAFANASAGSSG